MKRPFASPARSIAIAIAVAVFVAAPVPAAAQMGANPGKTTEAQGSKSAAADMSSRGDMHSSMMDNMKKMESMPSSGDIDRDFAQMMKMHHQGAIDMAQMELKNGKDAKLRAMARRIISDQQKEIKEFDQWLAGRNGKK